MLSNCLSLTCLCKSNEVETTLSLDWINVNLDGVNMSTSWSLEDRNMTSISFLATIFLTKWKSISTCFVWAWKIGFAYKYVAPVWSHHKIGGCHILMPSSCNKDLSHWISATILASALYFAYVPDWATFSCFLLNFYEIRFCPKKT